MSSNIDRREFLKLLGLLPLAYHMPAATTAQNSVPNILILIFDTWSALNNSLYGYPRQTTPNLERLAEKAIVYHNHYAGGHFTSPGTATMLTGVHPWEHRNFSASKKIAPFYTENNLFSLFSSHHRLAYTHNPIASLVLDQLTGQLDEYKPRQDLFLNRNLLIPKIFGKDYDIASVSWVRVIKKFDDGYANSVFFSWLYDALSSGADDELRAQFPRDLPFIESDNYFLLEDAIDWLHQQMTSQMQPYLNYIHLLPPHAPYNTRIDFYDLFANDGYKPPHKPDHPFSEGLSYQSLKRTRQLYDEYICYVDAEIGRLFSMLEASNALDNTWVILTSDHGEMTERGISGHVIPALYQPLVQVPLLIFPPGQQERVDVHTPTSMVDLLPTLLQISGKPLPGWLEGELLPPFNQSPDPEQSIYVIESFHAEMTGKFPGASIMLRKGDFKLTYSFGNRYYWGKLKGKPYYDLYDLGRDPEELNNIYKKRPKFAQTLLDEMLAKLREKGAI